MIKKIKTELIYFSVLLIILALLMHPDLLSSPLDRLQLMSEKENYFHPLLWASLIYMAIGLIRLIFKYLFYLKNRNKK